MDIQKSFSQSHDCGVLYLVPTPIGNLEDMTFRAIRILKEADVIAAEDTRNTKKLCNYFEIDTPLVSYHEHNKLKSGPQLIERMENGETIALVSDAGIPCISDPGYEVMVQALAANIPVIPLPGANAALTGLIASGIAPQPFLFYGFLSRGKKERKEELNQLKVHTSTLIFYEAPHRLKDTLKAMQEVLGNREIVLTRELTKKFEEFIRTTIDNAIEWAQNNEIRGEFCLIVEGNEQSETSDEKDWWEDLDIKVHVEYYMEEKRLSSKAAIKQVATDRHMPKRDIYQAYHIDE